MTHAASTGDASRDQGVSILLPHFRPHKQGLQTAGGRIIELDHMKCELVARCHPEDGLDAASLPTRELAALGGLEDAGYVVRLPSLIPPVPTGLIDIILSPHIDDAALSLGGTMALRGSAEETIVINIFSSQSYQTGLRVAADRLDEIAGAEDRLAGRLLSYQSRCLGLRGARERHDLGMKPVMGWTAAEVSAQDRVQRDIALVATRAAAAVRDALSGATLGRLFAPAGIGGHLDHLITALAAPRIAETVGIGQHRIIFYEDLPYAAGQMRGGVDLSGCSMVLEDISAVDAAKRAGLSVFRTRLRTPQIELCMAHAARSGTGAGPAERRFMCRELPSWRSGHEAISVS